MGCHVQSPIHIERQPAITKAQTTWHRPRMPLVAQSKHAFIFSLCLIGKAAQSAGKNALLGAFIST